MNERRIINRCSRIRVWLPYVKRTDLALISFHTCFYFVYCLLVSNVGLPVKTSNRKIYSIIVSMANITNQLLDQNLPSITRWECNLERWVFYYCILVNLSLFSILCSVVLGKIEHVVLIIPPRRYMIWICTRRLTTPNVNRYPSHVKNISSGIYVFMNVLQILGPGSNRWANCVPLTR